MKIKLATIPFRCDNYDQAVRLRDKMKQTQIILETRGDELSLLFEYGEWYVIVSTGNIRGMIGDLEAEGFM